MPEPRSIPPRPYRSQTGLPTQHLQRLFKAASGHPLEEQSRTFSAEQRQKASKEGAALADGSYPIYNQEDLNNAVQAIGRGNASPDTIKAHIRKRAKALGLKMPDSMSGDSS